MDVDPMPVVWKRLGIVALPTILYVAIDHLIYDVSSDAAPRRLVSVLVVLGNSGSGDRVVVRGGVRRWQSDPLGDDREGFR